MMRSPNYASSERQIKEKEQGQKKTHFKMKKEKISKRIRKARKQRQQFRLVLLRG